MIAEVSGANPAAQRPQHGAGSRLHTRSVDLLWWGGGSQAEAGRRLSQRQREPVQNEPHTTVPGFAEYCRSVAAEGAVLLRNEGNVLPLTPDRPVAIFGRMQIDLYRSGTGSGGSVNVPYTTNLLDGLRSKSTVVVDEALAATYEQWVSETSNQAQLECALRLGNRRLALLQTNGTGGRWVRCPVARGHLDAGGYRVGFEYIRAGMHLRELVFERVEEG